MEEKKIYFYSTDFCPFCKRFKSLLKILNLENMFEEINLTELRLDKKIILQEDTQIYTPIFFYYENNKKVLINNDILLEKLSKKIN